MLIDDRFDRVLKLLRAAYDNQRVTEFIVNCIRLRHEGTDHLVGDSTSSLDPVLVGALHNGEVAQLARFLILGQVLIEDDVELQNKIELAIHLAKSSSNETRLACL